MPQAHRDTERAARVSGRGLNPDLVERALAEDATVANAVQRHAAGETKIARAGLAVSESRDLQHHFFRDVLNRPRQVHFATGELRFGRPWRAAEQLVEPR